MKAIVTVIGRDKVGIIASVSQWLSELGLNIEDISQTVMQDFFTMMMMVDVSKVEDFAWLSAALEEKGKQIGLTIHIQHEDIFNAMHKI